MDEVRVRMMMGSIRLEFRGRRAFFEAWVEPLLHAAYARGEVPPGLRAAAIPPAARQEPRPVPEPEAPAEPAFKPTSPFHFNQFVGQVGARATQSYQQVMAFAFYLWNYEKREEFGLGDAEGFFRTLKIEPPADLATLLEDLAGRRRFLENGAGTAMWRLSSKGVNYVKNRLLGSA